VYIIMSENVTRPVRQRGNFFFKKNADYYNNQMNIKVKAASKI